MNKNLKPTFIIFIPAVVISIIAIFFDPCILGISFFMEICFLSLRSSLITLWPVTIIIAILFIVLNFTLLKKLSSKIKYTIAVILIIIVPIASFFAYLGLMIRSENIEQKEWKEKVEENKATLKNIEMNGGRILISNLKEEYRYNDIGKIEYIDIFLDVASEMPIDVRASLIVSGPPVGFRFFEDADTYVSLDSTPKRIVFPVKVNGKEPLSGREYQEGPFSIKLYFKIFSPEYKNKFGIDFISMGYENSILKTRAYKLSEFVDVKNEPEIK